jgi:hypothetical protein
VAGQTVPSEGISLRGVGMCITTNDVFNTAYSANIVGNLAFEHPCQGDRN